jgi:hypothetical protein
MAVKGSSVELAQKINAIKTRIDTIAYWDIDEAVFSCNRHGWFTSQLS